MRQLLRRAWYLIRQRRVEADLREELAFHQAEKQRDLERGGSDATEAPFAARRALGSTALAQDQSRDVWTPRWLQGLGQDVRLASRSLRSTPVTTAVAILTLALGIGATTSVFALLNALEFRHLPVRHPEELVQMSVITRTVATAGFSVPMFRELTRSQDVFSELIGWSGGPLRNVDVAGEPVQANLLSVTGNFYADLGVAPFAGRLLAPGDMNLATFTAAAVVVLGHGFWERQCGADLSMIGRTIRIESHPFTVIGIAPKGFTAFSGTTEPDVTIPLSFEGQNPADVEAPGLLWLRVVGRLKPGISLERARAQLAGTWSAVKAALVPATYPSARRAGFLALGLSVESGATGIPWWGSRFIRPLSLVMGIGLIVLAIACVNVAGLMLARAVGGAHDVGIRVALGASGWRLARQVLVEALVLSSLGAAGGLVLAQQTGPAIARVMLQDIPNFSGSLPVAIDTHVLALTIAITAAVCVLSSLLPAWYLRGRHATGLLPHGERLSVGIGRAGHWLVATQIALSIVASVDAGLLVRTLQHLASVDPGFHTSGVTAAELLERPGVPTLAANAPNDAYYRTLVDDVSSHTGVQAVSLSHGGIPLSGGYPVRNVTAATAPDDLVPIAFDAVSPGFFEVLGIRQLQGRDFTWRDDSRSARVAVISRSLAERLFPGRNAIGQDINIGSHTVTAGQHIAVIGVVNDITLYDVKAGTTLSVFIPVSQDAEPEPTVVLVRGTPSVTVLRQAVNALGQQYVFRVRPLEHIADLALTQEQLTALVAVTFGSLAVLIGAMGLYGLMAYLVTRRRREFAIRVALGARYGVVMRLVLRQGARVGVTGITAGLAMAVLQVQLVRPLLYGVQPIDPLTLTVAPMLLAVVATLACIVPASRAARVDPLIILREE